MSLRWCMLLVVPLLLGAAKPKAGGNLYDVVLLDNSGQAATMAECERAHPERGRPLITVSRQGRSNEPFHHRYCVYPKGVQL